MLTSEQDIQEGSFLETLLGDDVFFPAEPQNLDEVGVSPVLIERLLCKYLLQVGSATGREIAKQLCLPFGILKDMFAALRSRQVIVHQGQAQLNDYLYALTEEGTDRAQVAMDASAYVGPVPVPLDDYILAVEAQTIRAEAVHRQNVEQAMVGISADPELLDVLGPAVNSGAGLFLYGPPGNGKTTLAKRVTRCFGQHVWIPRVLIEDGQIIKLFDAACHEPVEEEASSIIKTAGHDHRWIKISRPTVVVGGELTLDSLEIRHDPNTNTCEASLQLKSNCGCLLIDDFGRQRVEPKDLLNRWIVPLENRHDFLTLPTGKKIQVPFEQLIIFSTNLEPLDLADEAFLRRIPYKIEIGDPKLEEFRDLFEMACADVGCVYHPDAVDYLVVNHYRSLDRPLRRCHPRDLLAQIKNYCRYHDRTVELRPDYLDRVVHTYFTAVSHEAAAERRRVSTSQPIAQPNGYGLSDN